jgi:hypothetical protein
MYAATSMLAFRAVRHRDDIAAAGDEARLLPGFQAPGGALSLPSPPSAELGRRQVRAPAWLTAQPFERRRLVERPDGCDIRHRLSVPHCYHLIVWERRKPRAGRAFPLVSRTGS